MLLPTHINPTFQKMPRQKMKGKNVRQVEWQQKKGYFDQRCVQG